MTTSVYRRDNGAYAVGHYDPEGTWIPESEFEEAEDAARRVAFLNGGESPATKVITVRMSPELHEALKAAAHERKISLNRLCVQLLREEVHAAPTG